MSPDESSVEKVRIARQARSEESKKLFQNFRQGANEVFIASMAIERVEEVEHLSERQVVLIVLMESKINMQKVAPEDFQRQIFQEFKKLEEQKTMEALELHTKGAQVDQMEKLEDTGPWSGTEVMENAQFIIGLWEYFTLERAEVRKILADPSREKQEGIQGLWQQESPFREVLEQVKSYADTDCGSQMMRRGSLQ